MELMEKLNPLKYFLFDKQKNLAYLLLTIFSEYALYRQLFCFTFYELLIIYIFRQYLIGTLASTVSIVFEG
jgi:hypothetical protein